MADFILNEALQTTVKMFIYAFFIIGASSTPHLIYTESYEMEVYFDELEKTASLISDSKIYLYFPYQIDQETKRTGTKGYYTIKLKSNNEEYIAFGENDIKYIKNGELIHTHTFITELNLKVDFDYDDNRLILIT